MKTTLFLLAVALICGCSQKPTTPDPNAARIQKLEERIAQLEDKINEQAAARPQPFLAKPVYSKSVRSAAEDQPPSQGAPLVLSVSARVTEANSVWFKWATIVTIANTNSEPVTFDYFVQFLDKDGFSIDQLDAYDVTLAAGATNKYTPYQIISLPQARNIKSFKAGARLRGQ